MSPESQPRASRPAAFVLGLGANGYGHVRALGASGVEVVGVYRGDEEAGRFSKYCSSRRLGAGVRTDDDICRALIGWRTEFQENPVLFASSDKYAALLSTHHERLAEHFRFHWVPWPTLQQIVDKAKVSRLCESAGVIAPRTRIPQPSEDVVATVSGLRFPCIVKPIRSFDLDPGASRRAHVVASVGALKRLFETQPGLRGNAIIQELIEGTDDEVYQCNILVAADGAIAATCGVRKLQQFPPGYGKMCFGRTEAHPELIERSVRLLDAVEYRGLASLEFKRSRTDGEFYFIEMNPRLPWYNSLFVEAGVNLAHLAFEDLTQARAVPLPAAAAREDVHWLRFGQSIRSAWLGRSHGFWPAVTRLTKADCYAWWDARDPVPCIGEVIFRSARYVRGLGGLASRFVPGRWQAKPHRAA
jgi:predicted ATP-grasp superfamily ATP-dependent carboligase